MIGKRVWTIALVLLALALPAAAEAQQKQPKAPPAGTKVERDLEYVKDGHERKSAGGFVEGSNRLDIYQPEKAADSPLPLVIWIHGGSWKQGSKDNCPIAWMAAKGYAIASINYRFLQHAEFPAQIEDCKASVRWLRANAKKYNLDVAHVGAMGGSAGGHLASLLGTAGDVKELEGKGGNLDQPSRVQAVCDLFGPLGIPGKNAAKGRVVPYISKDTPPFLIIHGDADKTVPFSQSETLTAALKKANIEVTFVPIKGAGHGGPEFSTDEMKQRYLAFFDKHLKKAAPKKT